MRSSISLYVLAMFLISSSRLFLSLYISRTRKIKSLSAMSDPRMAVLNPSQSSPLGMARTAASSSSIFLRPNSVVTALLALFARSMARSSFKEISPSGEAYDWVATLTMLTLSAEAARAMRSLADFQSSSRYSVLRTRLLW